MENLKNSIRDLKEYIELNTTLAGNIVFEASEACELRCKVETLEKDVLELEKRLNYNKEAENFKNPNDRKIEGKAPVSSRVEHPSHYTWLKEKCGIEVIDITRHLNFNIGNVVKYVLRSGHKSEEGMSDRQKQIEDLQKAAFYIGDEIKRLKEEKI